MHSCKPCEVCNLCHKHTEIPPLTRHLPLWFLHRFVELKVYRDSAVGVIGVQIDSYFMIIVGVIGGGINANAIDGIRYAILTYLLFFNVLSYLGYKFTHKWKIVQHQMSFATRLNSIIMDIHTKVNGNGKTKRKIRTKQ